MSRNSRVSLLTARALSQCVASYIAKLQALDTDGVEPMAHPMRLTNRLAADVPVDGMSIEEFLMNAPATEGRFLAVPKVLADGGGA